MAPPVVLSIKILSSFVITLTLAVAFNNCSQFSPYQYLAETTASKEEVLYTTFPELQEALFIPKCVSCHSGELASGGIDLSSYDSILTSNTLIPYNSGASLIYIAVSNGSMPPDGRVSSALLKSLRIWIDEGAKEYDDSIFQCKDPGKLYPRLTKFEYENIIFDVIGNGFDASVLNPIPQLPPLYGFDRTGSAVIDRTTAETYFEISHAVAEQIVASSAVTSLCNTTPQSWTNCGRPVAESMSRKLYRRPIRNDERTRLQTVYSNTFALAAPDVPQAEVAIDALEDLLSAMLMSANFLYKMEYFHGGYSANEEQYRKGALLSLLTGSTSPDAITLQKAAANQLNGEAVAVEAGRLINKHRSRFSQSFAGQWFGFSKDLNSVNALKRSMSTEAKLVFEELVIEDEILSKLLNPGFTYLNQTLGNHYGISTAGAQFTRVATNERGGILNQGHFLTRTVSGNESNPIKRGIWTLDAVLCRTLPSLSAATFEEIADAQSQVDPNAPIVVRMEQHRSFGNRCTACHSQMDPIGLALENWDKDGRFRTTYPDGSPVVADLEFEGQLVSNPYELANLVSGSDEFRNCVRKKLEAYVSGIDSTQPTICGKQITTDRSIRELTIEAIYEAVEGKGL